MFSPIILTRSPLHIPTNISYIPLQKLNRPKNSTCKKRTIRFSGNGKTNYFPSLITLPTSKQMVAIRKMQTSNIAITNDDNYSSVTVSDNDDNAGISKNDVVPFSEGDKVLAYHHRFIYEAKVRDVDSEGLHFLVHYIGWKSKWDEWVGMDRLMKHNQENLLKQKALKKEHPLEITKSGRTSYFKPKNPNVKRGRPRKTMSKGTASYGKLIDLQIPSTLKKHLINYWEYITHMGKLVKLPCSPNIDDILKIYLEQWSNKDGRDSDLAGEFLSGVRCYFDQALPAMLLYKGERQQYEEATANEFSPSRIYGAEHLLRLFVKLPEILNRANIKEDTLAELQPWLQEFLKFLQNNESLFFQSTYETPAGSCTIE